MAIDISKIQNSLYSHTPTVCTRAILAHSSGDENKIADVEVVGLARGVDDQTHEPR